TPSPPPRPPDLDALACGPVTASDECKVARQARARPTVRFNVAECRIVQHRQPREMQTFGQFERLHFARLAVLDDPTLGDIEAHSGARPSLPGYLAFIASCDGAAGEGIEIGRARGRGRS